MQDRSIQRFILEELKRRGETTQEDLIHNWPNDFGSGGMREFKHNLRLLHDAGAVELFEDQQIQMVQLTNEGHFILSSLVNRCFYYFFNRWIAVLALLVSIASLLVSIYVARVQIDEIRHDQALSDSKV